MLLDYDALQLKTFARATVLYDGGQLKLRIRLEDLLLFGNCFCLWFTLKIQVHLF
jgi:hypothetical protein